jgi:hypothetical protein
LDEVHLSFLADLDKGGSFRAEVHEKSLSFFACLDRVIVV